MNVAYQYTPSMPYELYDSRSSRMERDGKDVRMYFENGFTQMSDAKRVPGNLLIQNVDWEKSHIHLLGETIPFGAFDGRKVELDRFIRQLRVYTFEIISESYGYQTVTYSGNLYLPDWEKLIHITIFLSYSGKIIYEVPD